MSALRGSGRLSRPEERTTKETNAAAASPAPAAASAGIAYALAALAMIIYSSPPVVTRAVNEAVPALALSFSRWAIAFVILLPFAWPKLAAEWSGIRAHWVSLTLMIVPMIVGSTMSVLAVYYTTATNAVLVNASQPALTAMLGWMIAGIALSGRQMLGIACAFAGIVVMIAQADIGRLMSLKFNVGDFIMLVAVLGWSLYAVLLGRAKYSPHWAPLMLMIAAVGSVLLAPAALIERAAVGTFTLGGDVLLAMLYLAVFPSVLATVAWNTAIRTVGPNRAAIFVNLIPVSGAALAVVFLGERLFAYHVIGAVFVIAGVWLAVRRR